MSPAGIVRELRGSLPTVRVIVVTLAAAMWRRLVRIIRRDPPLRVGIDIRPFYEPLTGIGWYLYYILAELGKRDDVEIVLFGDARLTDEGPEFHAEVPSTSHYSVFDLRGLPASRFSRPMTAGAFLALIWIEGCDVIFGSNYFLPRLMDSVARRRVVTVHDMTYRRFPELLQKETLENLEREMARSVTLADEIICVSNATKRDLLEFYEIDSRRVHAILSGTSLTATESPPRRPQSIDAETRYILFVSTIEPRKNLDVLIAAFEEIAETWVGDLVVVGRVGWKADATLARMKRSRHAARIRHLDYVSRGDLRSLYAHADVFVMPSIYEGFGLPILEAMAGGTPVIAADSSSLPEVGGAAARYFPPESSERLQELLTEVLTNDDERARMVEAGRDRVKAFRWEHASEQTLDVFRRAAGRSE